MFFSNIPHERLEWELRAHDLPTDMVTSAYPCILISTGMHRVLVDTGAGNMAPSTGEPLRNLEKAGTRTTEIDSVILAHEDADHIERLPGREASRPPSANKLPLGYDE